MPGQAGPSGPPHRATSRFCAFCALYRTAHRLAKRAPIIRRWAGQDGLEHLQRAHRMPLECVGLPDWRRSVLTHCYLDAGRRDDTAFPPTFALPTCLRANNRRCCARGCLPRALRRAGLRISGEGTRLHATYRLPTAVRRCRLTLPQRARYLPTSGAFASTAQELPLSTTKLYAPPCVLYPALPACPLPTSQDSSCNSLCSCQPSVCESKHHLTPRIYLSGIALCPTADVGRTPCFYLPPAPTAPPRLAMTQHGIQPGSMACVRIHRGDYTTTMLHAPPTLPLHWHSPPYTRFARSAG